MSVLTHYLASFFLQLSDDFSVCNEIGMWNVKAYQNLESETENFHFNTKITHQMLKHEFNGEMPANDHMADMGRLPYTNSWRLPGLDSDCGKLLK